MVDEVFSVIDPAQIFAGQAQPLGALGTDGDQDGLKAGLAQVAAVPAYDGQAAAAGDRATTRFVTATSGSGTRGTSSA